MKHYNKEEHFIMIKVEYIRKPLQLITYTDLTKQPQNTRSKKMRADNRIIRVGEFPTPIGNVIMSFIVISVNDRTIGWNISNDIEGLDNTINQFD